MEDYLHLSPLTLLSRLKKMQWLIDLLLDHVHKSRLSVYQSAAQSIPRLTYEKITFNEIVYDAQNEWDPVNFRFVAKEAGYYLIIADVTFGSLDDQKRGLIRIYRSTVFMAEGRMHVSSAGVTRLHVRTSRVLALGVGDFIEIYCWHNEDNPEVLIGGFEFTSLNVFQLR